MKSDLQCLFIWSLQNENEIEYWISLGRYVSSAGIYPIYFLPSNASRQTSLLRELGFRVLQYQKTIDQYDQYQSQHWSYRNLYAVFMDSTHLLKAVQKQFAWLLPSQLVVVITLQRSFHFRLYPFSRKIAALPEHIKRENEIWIPIQAKQKFISLEMAVEEKKKFALNLDGKVVKVHLGDPYQSTNLSKPTAIRNRLHFVILLLEEYLKQIESHSKNTVVLLYKPKTSNEMVYEIISTHLYRYLNKCFRIDDFSDTSSESFVDAVWFLGTDKQNLYFSWVTYASLGIPILATNEESNTLWVGAGFGEESNPIHLSLRWMEKTNELLNRLNWEERRKRVQQYWQRYSNEQHGKRIVEWIQNQPKH
ncbi:MAG: hypothetical protein N2450_00605 [bacterium]|nr:hypothetical protein [bacterium]